jgi:hypothetical protein
MKREEILSGHTYKGESGTVFKVMGFDRDGCVIYGYPWGGPRNRHQPLDAFAEWAKSEVSSKAGTQPLPASAVEGE